MSSKIQVHKGTLDPETGWMVTPQEAYLPEEWEEAKHECGWCGDEFVLYTPGDEDISMVGRRSSYCSDDCQREAHRRQAREWVRKHRLELAAAG